MGSSLYDELGCAPGSSADEVQAAYRAAAKRTHPDVAGPGSAAAFRRVAGAWEVRRRRPPLRRTRCPDARRPCEVLRDPASRAAYDRSLASPDGHFADPAHHGGGGDAERFWRRWRERPDDPSVRRRRRAGAGSDDDAELRAFFEAEKAAARAQALRARRDLARASLAADERASRALRAFAFARPVVWVDAVVLAAALAAVASSYLAFRQSAAAKADLVTRAEEGAPPCVDAVG